MSSKQNHPNHNLIIGYTTRQHLLLDLDKSSLTQVRGLTKLIQQSYPEVGDALILESSPPHKPDRWHYQHYGSTIKIPLRPNHHVVFDGYIGYEKCVKIITALVDLNVLPEEYRNIREWRGDMTLRVSPKPFTDRTVPMPTFVEFITKDLDNTKFHGIESYIDSYCATWLLFRADLEAETETDQSSNSTNNRAQHNTVLLED